MSIRVIGDEIAATKHVITITTTDSYRGDGLISLLNIWEPLVGGALNIERAYFNQLRVVVNIIFKIIKNVKVRKRSQPVKFKILNVFVLFNKVSRGADIIKINLFNSYAI